VDDAEGATAESADEDSDDAAEEDAK